MKFIRFTIVFLGSVISIFSHANGTYFRAENADCLVWNENPQPQERVIFQGICENGYANGPAIVRWYVRDKLIEMSEGFYKNGHISGVVKMTAERWSYIGEYSNRNFNGRGKLTTTNATYEGTFLNGKLDGFGAAYYTGGGKYVGNWRLGEYEGEGVLYNRSNQFAGIAIFKAGKFVRLADVYNQDVPRFLSSQPYEVPSFRPPVFIEPTPGVENSLRPLNDSRSVNVILPSGKTVNGTMWSTNQPGTINGGTFIQLNR